MSLLRITCWYLSILFLFFYICVCMSNIFCILLFFSQKLPLFFNAFENLFLKLQHHHVDVL